MNEIPRFLGTQPTGQVDYSDQSPDNGPMNNSPWQERIERAQELAEKHSFAREMLGFYIHVARLQGALYWRLTQTPSPATPRPSISRELDETKLAELSSSFESFLLLSQEHGPRALAEISGELRSQGRDAWQQLLKRSWADPLLADAPSLLALAVLQPYAEWSRSHISAQKSSRKYALCPHCQRKPVLGVLRPLGEGAARSLICSFCLGEWEFRRLVCPACGEENDQKLPVFTASDFDHLRVECCESCKTYIKTIDLTKNGRAEPIVDEIAAIPLDLWAQEHGYAKLQRNVLGM